MAAIRLTTPSIPSCFATQSECQVPVVAVFEPLRTTWTESPQVHLEDIGRCKECAAYINHLCLFERTGWACSLCGCLNEYANAQNVRYLGGPSARRALPELAPLPDIHACSDTYSSSGGGGGGVNAPIRIHAPHHAPTPTESRPSPATIVLLDASAGAELLDLFRNTLVSALEALPQGSRLGIAAFVDEELVLYEPSANASQGGTPAFTAWHVPLVCPPMTENGIDHQDDQHYHHEEDDEPSVVDAVDVIPLHQFLTPVDSDSNKHQLATMIDGMLADFAVHTEPPSEDRNRPLGEAIQTLLRYLSGGDPFEIAGSRLAIMLGGLPNHGRGSLANRCENNRGVLVPNNDNPPSDKSGTSQSLPLDPYFPEVTAWGFPVSVLKTDPEDEDDDFKNDTPDDSKHSKRYSPRALAFYANAGAAAASINVAIDVVAVLETEKEEELDVIGDLLVNKSGGFLLCYAGDVELDECRLPQDWCKLLSEPCFGYSCTMRLRCSPELKVGPCLGGRLVQDATYHDIFYVPRVHAHDTFGIELQLVRGRQVIKSPPVVQLVVQYTCVDSLSASIQRRVHIMTAVIPLADTVLDVFAFMDAEVSAWALFNSVRDALRLSSSPSSVSELKMWIEKHLEARSSALKRCLDERKVTEKTYGDGDGDAVTELQEYESFYRFMHYARAIYQRISLDHGFLGNLTCISETLPPMELATLLYPHLSRWSSPEEVSRQWLPLPQSSLMDSSLMGEPWIYLVDSYSDIIIYYSKAAVVAHPFPPGRNSRIMSHATALRAARRMTPSLVIVQKGDDVTSLKHHVENLLKKFCFLY